MNVEAITFYLKYLDRANTLKVALHGKRRDWWRAIVLGWNQNSPSNIDISNTKCSTSQLFQFQSYSRRFDRIWSPDVPQFRDVRCPSQRHVWRPSELWTPRELPRLMTALSHWNRVYGECLTCVSSPVFNSVLVTIITRNFHSDTISFDISFYLLSIKLEVL